MTWEVLVVALNNSYPSVPSITYTVLLVEWKYYRSVYIVAWNVRMVLAGSDAELLGILSNC